MTIKREDQVAEAAEKYADENYPELTLARENEQLADVAETAFRAGAVFEQSVTPTNDEREALAITDEEWRELQTIPEQGYSHRHWVDSRIAERVMRDRRRPVQGEPHITIEHEGGNTITGTAEQVLNHGHLKSGWKFRGASAVQGEPTAEVPEPSGPHHSVEMTTVPYECSERECEHWATGDGSACPRTVWEVCQECTALNREYHEGPVITPDECWLLDNEDDACDCGCRDGFPSTGDEATSHEPSDAQADAVAQAIIDHDEDRLTCYDHDGFCCPCGGLHGSTRQEWERHRARTALRAAAAATEQGGKNR